MKHEHTLEVKVPQELTDTVDDVRDHFETNKQAYLFGLGGLALGIVGTRLFSRAPVNVTINNLSE